MSGEAPSLAGFVRALRSAGFSVPVSSSLAYTEALAALAETDRAEPGTGDLRVSALYWAGRATLVQRASDIPGYDAAFRSYWGAEPSPAPGAAVPSMALAVDDLDTDGDTDEERAGRPVVVRWSPGEVLRTKDFAACSPTELDELHRLMSDLRLTGAQRRSRRRRPTRRAERLDLRRTLRRSTATGGEIVSRRFTANSSTNRRVVLLCDVSGSMEPYARVLVRFAHAAVAARARVEAFAIGTRLTRLTRELSTPDPDAALAAVGLAVPDWSGGTRLGEGLRAFNDAYGVRGLARGAIVVVLSDGWDRGDPDVLASEMARLRRVAHRVVWVNPLRATEGYEPLARGMAAALPYVDEFLDGHSLESLDELARVVAAP